MAKEIKTKPYLNKEKKIGQYQFGESNQALCEQLRHMQKDMNTTKRSIEELLDMNKQILQWLQKQQKSLESVISKAEKASDDADKAIKIMSDSAEAMKINTDMIVKASLIAAFSIADEDKFNNATKRADEEMRKWKNEEENQKQTNLKLL